MIYIHLNLETDKLIATQVGKIENHKLIERFLDINSAINWIETLKINLDNLRNEH